MGVTHVIRGADLIASTDVHRLLQALLGLPTPLYRHHALVCGADGKRLANRDAAASLASLRAAGIEGRALAADLAADRLPPGYSLRKSYIGIMDILLILGLFIATGFVLLSLARDRDGGVEGTK